MFGLLLKEALWSRNWDLGHDIKSEWCGSLQTFQIKSNDFCLCPCLLQNHPRKSVGCGNTETYLLY